MICTIRYITFLCVVSCLDQAWKVSGRDGDVERKISLESCFPFCMMISDNEGFELVLLSTQFDN